MTRDGKSYFHLGGAIDSVVAVTDEAGEKVNTYSYSPRGVAHSTTNEKTPSPTASLAATRTPPASTTMRPATTTPTSTASPNPAPPARNGTPTSTPKATPVSRNDPSGLAPWGFSGEVCAFGGCVGGGVSFNDGGAIHPSASIGPERKRHGSDGFYCSRRWSWPTVLGTSSVRRRGNRPGRSLPAAVATRSRQVTAYFPLSALLYHTYETGRSAEQGEVAPPLGLLPARRGLACAYVQSASPRRRWRSGRRPRGRPPSPTVSRAVTRRPPVSTTWAGPQARRQPGVTQRRHGKTPTTRSRTEQRTWTAAATRMRGRRSEREQKVNPEESASHAKSALWFTCSLAVTLNLVEELWHPPGTAWLVSRIAVSVLFTAALIACVVLWIVRSRQRRVKAE